MFESITKAIAKGISAILHPLLLPVYMVYVCLFLEPMAPYITLAHKLFYMSTAAISFVILPVFILILAKVLGITSSININEQSERTLPILIVAISYIGGIVVFQRMAAPSFLILIMKGVAYSMIATAFISYFWKISAHTTGIGGAMASLMLVSYAYHLNLTVVGIIIALLSGALAWSRLYLEHHDAKQVAAGFLNGLVMLPIPFYLHLIKL